jgi:sugar phosphate isomerase/epimerase
MYSSLFVCGLSLFVVGPSAVSVARAKDEASPARIAVVKTWKDLQSEPPITLGDGVKVRLGISADKGPRWSGAFLYCLTEGYVPASGGRGPVPLGPVHAAFTFGNAKSLPEQADWGAAKKKGGWPMGSYLFVRVLPVNRVGTYHVRVMHAKGRLVAEAALEGTRDDFHPWMPWFFLGEVEELAEQNPAAGIALPTWSRFGPVGFAEAGEILPGDLPTVIPAAPKPGFGISFDGDEVVIHANTEFTASRPELHFLARWWVNDKPFVPAQVKKSWEMMGYGLVLQEKDLRVPLGFAPDRLGAKPGDRIGLQLLYCPGGWNWCSGRGHGAFRGSEVPWMSNRIDFVAANPFYAMDTCTKRPYPKNDIPPAQQLDMLKELGYAGIAWTEEPPDQVRAAAALARKRGLKVFAIYCAAQVSAQGDLHYSEKLPEVMTALKDQGTIVWLHIGGKGPAVDSLTGQEPVVKKLRGLADIAAASGLRVALYPHVGEWTAHFRDATGLARLVKHPQFGVTFNLCHSLALGEEKRIPELLEGAKDLLFTVTINGADSGLARPDWGRLIQTLDRGTFKVGDVLGKLRKIGFTGPIGLQGYGIGGDRRENLATSMGAWRKLVQAAGR